MDNPLFNSNDYKRGYEEGYSHALEGKNKNFRGMGASLKFAIHGNNALNTYTQGYNQGFSIGMRDKVRNEASKNSQNINSHKKTHSTMHRGIDGQIELLNSMKQFLEGLSNQFDEINRQKQQFLNSLDGEGLDLKLLQRFEEYFQENRQKTNGLISKIESEDIPYTEQVIRYLEDTPR